jgi:nicotinamidase/pyrazinamidase
MERTAALLIIDVQNDFCPGGALAVPDGDAVVPVLNRAIERFRKEGLPVFASRDWHPAETRHFAAFGGPWPSHCVQDTNGAAFHPRLRLPADTVIVSKGMDPDRDDYAALHGRTSNGTPLPELLRARGVRHLYLGGLATDYCVKETALEALRQGFAVTVLSDGVRGVELQPGDTERAMAAMVAAGAHLVSSAEALAG